MNELTDAILRLIKQKGITKAQLERECGLANGTIRNWEIGRNNPSEMALKKISGYFGVSIGYCIKKERDTCGKLGMSYERKQVLKLAETLSDEDIIKLIDYANLLVKAKKQ